MVIDAGGLEHRINCDFISLAEESVMLMEDHRGPKSNRTEIIAYFTKPIMAHLVQSTE